MDLTAATKLLKLLFWFLERSFMIFFLWVKGSTLMVDPLRSKANEHCLPPPPQLSSGCWLSLLVNHKLFYQSLPMGQKIATNGKRDCYIHIIPIIFTNLMLSLLFNQEHNFSELQPFP